MPKFTQCYLVNCCYAHHSSCWTLYQQKLLYITKSLPKLFDKYDLFLTLNTFFTLHYLLGMRQKELNSFNKSSHSIYILHKHLLKVKITFIYINKINIKAHVIYKVYRNAYDIVRAYLLP